LLREWAVSLLNDHSPTKLSDPLRQVLATGKVNLPTPSLYRTVIRAEDGCPCSAVILDAGILVIADSGEKLTILSAKVYGGREPKRVLFRKRDNEQEEIVVELQDGVFATAQFKRPPPPPI
jgi:hypothetical protein